MGGSFEVEIQFEIPLQRALERLEAKQEHLKHPLNAMLDCCTPAPGKESPIPCRMPARRQGKQTVIRHARATIRPLLHPLEEAAMGAQQRIGIFGWGVV